MKKSRYTSEQVAFGLRLAEEGTPVSEVCHQMGHQRANLPPIDESRNTTEEMSVAAG